MIFNRKWLTPVAGMAAATFLLAACGGGESEVSGGSAGTAQSSAAASEAAKVLEPLTKTITWPEPVKLSKAVDVKGKTVWWVPIGDSVPAIHAQGEGFKQAIEAAGGTVKLCDGKFNPSDIGNCLASAGREQAAAVVTDYIDYAMVPNAFEQLKKEGVPVLIAGVAPPESKSSDAQLAFFDTTPSTNLLNEAAAAGALVAGGDSPTGLTFILTDSSATRTANEAAVKKWQTLCADCPLETIEFSTANLDKLSSQVSAALVKNPKINVVLVPDDSFVAPVEQAVKTVGSEIKVVSIGGNLANLQNVASGSQAGSIGVPSVYHGWEIANGLFQLLVGDEVKPKTVLTARYFDSSNVSSLNLTDTAFLSDEWYGDNSYKDAFRAAWQLG